jgi:hypothetical protein
VLTLAVERRRPAVALREAAGRRALAAAPDPADAAPPVFEVARDLGWPGRFAAPRRADTKPACRSTDLGTPPCSHAWMVIPLRSL